ncbi:hypothetical protein V8B97DRAFT_1918313 [Scleroderma yunnanense]
MPTTLEGDCLDGKTDYFQCHRPSFVIWNGAWTMQSQSGRSRFVFSSAPIQLVPTLLERITSATLSSSDNPTTILDCYFPKEDDCHYGNGCVGKFWNISARMLSGIQRGLRDRYILPHHVRSIDQLSQEMEEDTLSLLMINHCHVVTSSLHSAVVIKNNLDMMNHRRSPPTSLRLRRHATVHEPEVSTFLRPVTCQVEPAWDVSTGKLLLGVHQKD